MGSGRAQNRLGREARRFFSRFRNLSAQNLAQTILRALRLHWGSPVARPAPERRERVVVALSTIPARAKRLKPVLRSLIDQSEPPDRILLAYPFRTAAGEDYPPPEGLGLPPGIDIVRPADEGPVTKLLPALELEPEALLVVVDDDVIYPRRFIETLLAAHRRAPHAALGFRGVRLAEGTPFSELDHVLATGVRETTPVDVLFGTWGYLLPPRGLGEDVRDFSQAPPAVRWVDDVWISGHLAKAGVPRFVVRADDLPVETAASFRQALTAGVNRSGENDAIAVKHFTKHW